VETFKPSPVFKNTLKPFLNKEAKIFTWIITLLAFGLPLFFLPFTSEFYQINKIAFLYLLLGVMLLILVIKLFFEQNLKILKTDLNWPILGLVASFLLSSFLQAPNRPLSLLEDTGIILALALLYFFIVNYCRGKKPILQIMTALISSGVVLSWLTLFSFLGILSKTGPLWLENKAWTPTGSPLITAQLLLILMPGTFYWAFKTKDALKKILLFVASMMQVLSLVVILALFINKEVVLTYLWPNFGWQISVEGLKTIRTALFGVGPGNFLAAFNQFRPLGLNNTSLWAVKFITNSNQYLHLLSTVGILGLGFYLLILLKSLKKGGFKGSLVSKVIYICLAASFVIQLLLTSNVLILTVTFLLLALLEASKMSLSSASNSSYELKSQALAWSLAGLLLILTFFGLYWQTRIWLADRQFRKSLLAAQANKGAETYNLQIKALMLNPYAPGYRVTYSQTNLALANSITANKNLTDQDKESVRQLIAQAIREAKTAVNLNPQISSYWLNLANLYRNIINVVQDADQWAMATYLEAVRKDPTNPLLRVEFGGLFYGLKDYDRAITQFQQAVNLKPDYANGYYNLAEAYKAKEDWQNAFYNLQLTANLVEPDSPDYQKTQDELKEIQAKLETIPQATSSAQLKTEAREKLSQPQPLPSPNARLGEVKLPEDVKPEVLEEGEEATKASTP